MPVIPADPPPDRQRKAHQQDRQGGQQRIRVLQSTGVVVHRDGDRTTTEVGGERAPGPVGRGRSPRVTFFCRGRCFSAVPSPPSPLFPHSSRRRTPQVL